jgi:hypothetical protein
MFQLLEMTPWWVYILLTYFLMLGVKASNPSVVSIKKLAVIPVFFLCWAFYNLVADLESRYLFIIPWLFALLIGSFFGYLQVKNWQIQVDVERKTISLPGSWSTLALCISIFAVRYVFEYVYATNPIAYKNSNLFCSDLIFSNLIIGMFWGRFLHFGKSFYQEKS